VVVALFSRVTLSITSVPRLAIEPPYTCRDEKMARAVAAQSDQAVAVNLCIEGKTRKNVLVERT
jgi:hypothetical protein